MEIDNVRRDGAIALFVSDVFDNEDEVEARKDSA
jgi:hypothetical protein